MLRIAERYFADEAKVIPLLRSKGSISGAIFRELSLTRSIITEALDKLKRSRALQATLRSIICATRFKYFDGKTLLRTVCHLRGRNGSFRQPISRVTFGAPPKDSEQLTEYLAELAYRAFHINPNLPVPQSEGFDAELDLAASESEEDCTDGNAHLEFEDDTLEAFDAGQLLGDQ